MSDQKIMGQETAEPETGTQESVIEKPLAKVRAAKEPEEVTKAPEPSVVGGENITILKHDIYRKGGECDTTEAICVELIIKNISDVTIGSALFEAVLYDIEGNILDTVEQKTTELKPHNSRTISINYLGPKSDKVNSYYVRLAKTTMTPKPSVTDNERIKILKHSLSRIIVDDIGGEGIDSIELVIKNISDVTIGSALFEAVLYDIEGNILDTVEHKEVDLRENTGRAINIVSSRHQLVRSYDVRITRTITADVERVQLCRHEIKTTDTGEEEVRGIVKNLGNVRTDTAVVAVFYDPKKENIGTKVVILRDIEPNSIRQFHFLFKPQEGNRVSNYALNIGEIVESNK